MSYFCWAGEQKPQYDNLSFGIPSKADTIIDRPGYALGYIERHEQPAWVIYIMTKAEATTKAAKRTNKFRSDPEILTGSATAAGNACPDFCKTRPESRLRAFVGVQCDISKCQAGTLGIYSRNQHRHLFLRIEVIY